MLIKIYRLLEILAMMMMLFLRHVAFLLTSNSLQLKGEFLRHQRYASTCYILSFACTRVREW